MSEQSYFTAPTEYADENLSELPALNNFELSVLAAVEQEWWKNKIKLTPKLAAKKLNTEAALLEPVWKKPAFQHALRKKGIVTDQMFDGFLSTKQIEAANMVCNRYDNKSLREKLKMCGVTISQWNGWMGDTTFQKYLQSRVGTDFKSADYMAQNALLTAVEDGDLTAVKLYLEIRGIYQNKLQVDMNIPQFMQGVVEIMSKYIPEEHLEAAALDIERLYSLQTGRNTSDFGNVIAELAPTAVISI